MAASIGGRRGGFPGRSSPTRGPFSGERGARFSIKFAVAWPGVNEQDRLRNVEPTGYHVVLELDPEGGYVAVIPAFPGCYSQGDTAEEALSNAREAILLTIEDMRERGDAIPDPAGELVHRVAIGA
jgi:antitoxin HicB